MCQALRDIMRKDFDEAEVEGQNQMAALMTKLRELNRTDDAFRAAADPDFRQKMFAELGIA